VGTIGNLFDVQQVEVLRGPQAGAFGANAAGGVIRIVTNDPTPYWTGQVEGNVGNDSLYTGGFAMGGPLLENDPKKLTFRFSLHQLTQDGFRENVFLDKYDTNERDELTTRLKLRWLANQNWQFDGQLFYVDINNGFDVFTLANNRTKTFTDEPGRDTQKSLGISLRSSWLGNDLIEIVSTTAFSKSDSLYGFDGDFGAGFGAPAPFKSGYDSFIETKRDRDVFSQEIRVDSREDALAFGLIDRWTLGLYLESFDEITHTTGAFPVPSFNTDYEAETAGLFGQITHEASERLRFSLGLRGEYYQLDGIIDNEGNTIFNDGYGTVFPIIQRPPMEYNDTLFGGKITAEYDLSTEHLAFASFARGYKAGGINLSPSLDINAYDASFPSGTLPADYNTETLYNYELGIRSYWFEGTVETKFTAFYLQRDDAQLRGSVGSATSFTYFTVNVDEAEHFGLESEIDWKINRHWNVNLSGGLLETDRDQFSVAGAPRIISDRSDLSNSPKYTYAVRLNYDSLDDFFCECRNHGQRRIF
jgi:outer membrane receptor protein involved in Fe transport